MFVHDNNVRYQGTRECADIYCIIQLVKRLINFPRTAMRGESTDNQTKMSWPAKTENIDWNELRLKLHIRGS